MTLWQLFLSFFQVGLFSVGGGYASLPLIQEQIVSIHGWLTIAEFTDVISIAEMTPGAIAINAATFVGTQLAGPLGAIVATLGCILPSCAIVLTLAMLYKRYKNLMVVQGVLKGLRPAVVGLIASAGFSILLVAFWIGTPYTIWNLNLPMITLFLISFILLRRFKLNPILIIALCGAMGLLI